MLARKLKKINAKLPQRDSTLPKMLALRNRKSVLLLIFINEIHLGGMFYLRDAHNFWSRLVKFVSAQFHRLSITETHCIYKVRRWYQKNWLYFDYRGAYDFVAGWSPPWPVSLATPWEQFVSGNTCKVRGVSFVFFQPGFNLSRLVVFRARADATPVKSSEESLLHERALQILTRAGRDRHCRTCRARERTREWPVDRSSRSSRWKDPTPSRVPRYLRTTALSP